MAEQYDLPQRFAHHVPPIVTEALVTFVMIALPVGLRLLIEQSFHGVVPFVLIYPAIAGATLLAGLRSGVIVLVVCELLVWYFLLPVKESFRFEEAGNLLSLLLATNAGLLMLWLVSNYRKSARASADFEKRRAELAREHAGRLELLIAELHHRTRNLITVVRAIAESTLERSESKAEFEGKFRARLEALARAQGMLSHLSGQRMIALDHLLHVELAAHLVVGEEDARVTMEGPSGVCLDANIAQALALAIHELATNALKYGALAQSQAHLDVRWRVEPDGEGDGAQLHLEWRESGVVMPDSSATAPGGYGRELIERLLPYQLSARTSYALGLDGVHCTVTLPAAEVGAAAANISGEERAAVAAAL